MEIPKKFHFIWIGSNIPAKYLRTIEHMAKVAKKNNFEICLWTDRESHYYKTQAKENINIKNLRIRSIDELKEKLTFKDISLYIDRERVGFKNLSAASDLLRYEILHQEGGYYFDTDTTFIFNKNMTFTPDDAPYGILTAGRAHYKNNNNVEVFGSDIVAGVADHIVFKNTLKKILKNYKNYDEQKFHGENLYQNTYEKTLMDLKRSDPKERVPLSLKGSGPEVLLGAILDYLHELQLKNPYVKLSTLLFPKANSLTQENGVLAEYQVGGRGMTAQSRSDQSWFKTNEDNMAIDIDEKSPEDCAYEAVKELPEMCERNKWYLLKSKINDEWQFFYSNLENVLGEVKLSKFPELESKTEIFLETLPLKAEEISDNYAGWDDWIKSFLTEVQDKLKPKISDEEAKNKKASSFDDHEVYKNKFKI